VDETALSQNHFDALFYRKYDGKFKKIILNRQREIHRKTRVKAYQGGTEKKPY
jgi:hypothetical protein